MENSAIRAKLIAQQTISNAADMITANENEHEFVFAVSSIRQDNISDKIEVICSGKKNTIVKGLAELMHCDSEFKNTIFQAVQQYGSMLMPPIKKSHQNNNHYDNYKKRKPV